MNEPNKALLGEGTTVTAKFSISGTEYGGFPSPLTGITVHLPAGVGGSTSGFPTCPVSDLQNHEPEKCPQASLAGPPGSFTAVVSLGGTRVPEEGTIQGYFVTGGVDFWLEGRTPDAIEVLLTGTYQADTAPYSHALTLAIPLIETVPGAPAASITGLALPFGASLQQGASVLSSVTVPTECPTGTFDWAADASFYGDTSPGHILAQTACPTAATHVTPRIERLACPTSTLCVAVDSAERMLVSTDPAGGASSWSAPASIGLAGITGLACPTAALCVATDYQGHLTTSTNPAGGASTWSAAATIDPVGITQLQCPSSALCVAIDWNSRVLASTNPAGGASTWSAPSSLSAYVDQLACPSSGLCLATGFHGDVLTSIDPAGGAFAWSTPTNADDPSQYISGIACPTSTLCILSDNTGNVIVGTAPSVPSNTAPPTISGTAQQGQTLTEANGSWTSSPTSYAYQWQRCDASGSNCQPIGGAESPSYALTAADVGATVRVQETASNVSGAGTPVVSQQTPVVQAAPSGGTSNTTTTTATTPAPPPAATGSASVGSVKVGGSTLSELLSCAGSPSASCELTLTLTVTETLKGGKVIGVSASKKKKRWKIVKRTVTVGSVTVSLTDGKSEFVKISLNAAGKRLLASHHKLTAQLTTTAGQGTVISRRTVTFRAAAKHKRNGKSGRHGRQ